MYKGFLPTRKLFLCYRPFFSCISWEPTRINRSVVISDFPGVAQEHDITYIIRYPREYSSAQAIAGNERLLAVLQSPIPVV
jgi:hypothetical protein